MYMCTIEKLNNYIEPLNTDISYIASLKGVMFLDHPPCPPPLGYHLYPPSNFQKTFQQAHADIQIAAKNMWPVCQNPHNTYQPS